MRKDTKRIEFNHKEALNRQRTTMEEIVRSKIDGND